MRLLSLAVLLIVFLLGLSFAILNPDKVVLNYYFGESEVRISTALVLALVLGALLGLLSGLGVVLKQRARISRLTRAVSVTEKEVKNLRSLPIKDNH